jgi:glycogen debranching enzyme
MEGEGIVAACWTFLATDEAGRCTADHHGFYHRDTRHLDRYELAVGDRTVEPLAALAPRPGERVLYGLLPGDPPASVRRTRVVTGGGRTVTSPGVFERVEVRNEGSTTFPATLRLAAGTRFDDVLEVGGRADLDRTRSIGVVPGAGVAFSYDPDDAVVDYRTGVALDADAQVDVHSGLERADAVLGTDLRVPPGEALTVHVAAVAGEPPNAVTSGFEAACDRVRRRARDWWADLTPVAATGRRQDVLRRAAEDLLSLTVDTEYGPVFTAGLPWDGTPLGRDALLAAYMALPLTTGPAEATLRYLAANQAADVDERRRADPGKVMHEIRHGELATRGEVPHTPSYRAADATPLFVVLLHEFWRFTGDDDLVAALRSPLERAVDWLEASGDGFLRSPAVDVAPTRGGWTDGADGVVHPDGRGASGPLALAAVQGYAYDAMRRAAALYRAVGGDSDRARTLERQADVLGAAFDGAFWLDDASFYAVALDGDGDPVRSVTAAPGHCLWSGVVPDERADAIVDRLLADDCFSGWGVRTLSSAHDAYDPASAHRGSVHPHDAALTALGMARYGRQDAVERVANGLFGAAAARGNGLPGLFAGYGRAERDEVVPHPEACEPQARAATAPVACLRAVEGLGPALDH